MSENLVHLAGSNASKKAIRRAKKTGMLLNPSAILTREIISVEMTQKKAQPMRIVPESELGPRHGKKRRYWSNLHGH